MNKRLNPSAGTDAAEPADGKIMPVKMPRYQNNFDRLERESFFHTLHHGCGLSGRYDSGNDSLPALQAMGLKRVVDDDVEYCCNV